MRRRKRLLVAGGAVLLVVTGMAAWAALRPRPRFTMEQAKWVRVGMTVDEVAAVLGCAPGNYADAVYGPVLSHSSFETGASALLDSPDRRVLWAVDCGPAPGDADGRPCRQVIAILVGLDEHGRVAGIRTGQLTCREPTVIDHAASWLDAAWAKLGL